MKDILNESIVFKQYAVVKENDSNKPDIFEVDHLLENVIRDCRRKYFHSSVYRCVYGKNFTNITNNEEAFFRN